MTHLWSRGVPIHAVIGPDGLPQAFWWRGSWHQVASIANRWRVRTTWWSEEAWREYVKLTTAGGLLCVLYRDMRDGGWYYERLYD